MRSILLLINLGLFLITGVCLATLVEEESCQVEFVESMPEGLELGPVKELDPVSTVDAWVSLIDGAKRSLKIASMYVSLVAEPEHAAHPSTEAGKNVMEAIRRASQRSIKVEIVLDGSSKRMMSSQANIDFLKEIADVKFVNMTQILGSGILHTKFLIADDETFYVGSSNLDWRSLTQVKETGLKFKQCPKLAADLGKIFSTYQLVSGKETMPELGDDLKTMINDQNPIEVNLNGFKAKVFLSANPPLFFKGTGRSDDLDALLHIINAARSRLDISVMNYSPRFEFSWPKRYWPLIDDALRKAAVTRKVRVRILFSSWTSTRSSELAWYRSLNEIRSPEFQGGGIEVRLFRVPALDDFQKSVPHSRVKHDKYTVTDNGLYVSTNNWTPEYFNNACGVSVVIRPKDYRNREAIDSSLIGNFANYFERDWNSSYAMDMERGQKDWDEFQKSLPKRSFYPRKTNQ